MEQLWSHLKPWMVIASEENKKTLMNCLNDADNRWSSSIFHEYLRRLTPYLSALGIDKHQPRERDCLGSGLVFFYECLFYIMHYPDWGQYIDDIFLYNMLYLLVDHYMDDDQVPEETRSVALRQMIFLLDDPLSYRGMSLADDSLKEIALTYYQLVTRRPKTIASIRKLFMVQMETLVVQRNSTHHRSKYHQMSIRKGGLTIEVLADIVGETDIIRKSNAYHLGTIMQLIDDSLDVLSDRAKGFHTVATHDLARDGHLDQMWIEIGWRIMAIDSDFVLLRILYAVFFCYLPGRLPNCYSERARELSRDHNLFDYRYGCDGASLLTLALESELIVNQVLDTL